MGIGLPLEVDGTSCGYGKQVIGVNHWVFWKKAAVFGSAGGFDQRENVDVSIKKRFIY